jgi:hypothetical protein
MNRTGLTLAALLSLALASAAAAQSGGGSGSATTTTTTETQTQATGIANAQAHADANAQAALAAAEQKVKDKGAKVSADARAKAEAKLEASAKRADDEATAQGDAKVAGRLAAEFGMTADQIMTEKKDLSTSWGQLMIAHSLAANSKTDLTVEQLMDMRKDMGWGQIAAGLGLKLGETVSAVHAESQVATGAAHADGKVAVIHGEGARAGLGIGAGANAAGGAAHGAANAGVGAGIKIKP